MTRLAAIVALGLTLVGLVPVQARAGAATDAALGLGAFAVFNQLFGLWGAPYRERVVVVRPYAYYPSYPVVYAPPPVYVAPAQTYAPRPIQREVVYPHGRYLLEGDGVTVAYRWVWIPNPPPPPPPPPAAPAAPAAPPGSS